jgi:CubicO group peptidase (beta-lactamase class C family)
VVYENLPFLYLGQIIEKVTKKSLAEVFQDFLQKQGLNNTICGTKEDLLSIYSPPTERFNNQLIQNVTHDETARLLGGIAGNAGIFTSAHDLARFGQMWLDGTIVSDRQLFSMIWQDYDDSGKNPQGFGWFGRLFGKSLAETGVFVHPGFTGCMLAINLQKSKVCAFTCNRTMLGRNNKKHQDIMHALVQFIQ